MRSLKKSCMAILLSAVFIACGEGDKKKSGEETGKKTEEKSSTSEAGSPSRLEGAWEIKRAEGSMADMNVGTVYEFKGNKLSFGKDGFNNPGSTIITDSTFSFQADGNEYKFIYDYKFNGDTLVVAMQKSNQVFHLVKK